LVTKTFEVSITVTVDDEDADIIEVIERNLESGALQRALTRKAVNDIGLEATVGGARIIARRAGLSWVKGYEVHHVNGDPGDNRRSNLGILSASHNRSRRYHTATR
jgi:hypothetical protein